MRPEPAFLRGAHQRGFVSGASRVPTGSGRARRRRAGAEDQTRAARLPHPAALALLPEASPGSGPRPGHRASKPRRQRPCPGFQALGPSERGAAWKPQRSAPPHPHPRRPPAARQVGAARRGACGTGPARGTGRGRGRAGWPWAGSPRGSVSSGGRGLLAANRPPFLPSLGAPQLSLPHTSCSCASWMTNISASLFRESRTHEHQLIASREAGMQNRPPAAQGDFGGSGRQPRGRCSLGGTLQLGPASGGRSVL